ncbi:pyridoxamine 5'-phosphate oxidase [Defluviimonas sp. 20V17]|uniref:Pyridoxine biosynthesis protein n=1 Tax=Allgaiera indica TaxID=765699 RepID=A0AAN4UTR2_9RHOB|nr:pyridoxamine 5'-phosphate oxidase family protein [Allgaiera indica]KDB05561.1 pyridoxamine 5'-phosphate oxidase [Defluviimonas sp. 20V17]GHE03613.1 pyridoxine biosynthesis protein [Allgaiera indica]SDX44943.1 hypothetical protein SAMN05444006_11676 [Allgaiera indica]
MDFIDSTEALETLYGTPAEAAKIKVAHRLTPAYRAWIGHSRFCLLSTVGPEGTDCSPRGDDGPVVRPLDEATLALPDWRGNQRLDSLRNIVRDPRVSLTFLVPRSDTVVRVNGMARVTADAGLRARFDRQGRQPGTVIVITLTEIYFQCARALKRSGLWSAGAAPEGLPSPGDILHEQSGGSFDGATYDADWPGRAAKTLW